MRGWKPRLGLFLQGACLPRGAQVVVQAKVGGGRKAGEGASYILGAVVRRLGKLRRPQWSQSPSAVGPRLGWKTALHGDAVGVVPHCLCPPQPIPAVEWVLGW